MPRLLTDAERSVLLKLRLLAATNSPQAAYENVPGGEEAWAALLRDGLIAEEEGLFALAIPGFIALRG